MPAVVGRRAPKEAEARPREPKTATVERREASVPRHGTQGASQAPGVSRHDTPHGCRWHPNVSRRSAHPSIRVSEAKLQAPDAKNAPRERAGLFDIVRWITKASESAACPGCDAARASASSASLIRDRQELGPRSRVCSAPLRAALRPGHASEVHFGETNPSGEHARERRTNLRLHKITAGVISLFPACYLQ
jgi:hypothetical protein